MEKLILLTFFNFLLCLAIRAQEYIQYTTKDGLLSNLGREKLQKTGSCFKELSSLN